MSSATPSTLPPPILGAMEEICIVTPDYKKTIDGLTRLGIGPFKIFKFDSTTVPKQEIRGHRATFELIACFATQGSLTFEVMQPLTKNTPMAQYLRENGGQDGVQHLAFGMGGGPMVQRVHKMRERGFEPAMQGWWRGRKGMCHFCFFETKEAFGTVVESIEFSEDWEEPEFEWYPQPPAE